MMPTAVNCFTEENLWSQAALNPNRDANSSYGTALARCVTRSLSVSVLLLKVSVTTPASWVVAELPAQRLTHTEAPTMGAKRTARRLLGTKLQNCSLVQTSANRRESFKSEHLHLNPGPALSLCTLREVNEPLCAPLSMNNDTNLKDGLHGLKEITCASG